VTTNPLFARELTVGQYLESWITGTLAVEVKNKALSPKTAADYADNARRHIIPALGHYGLAEELKPPHIRTWLAAKRGEISFRGRQLSDRSVQYYFATLRRALADAVRDGLVDRNVALLVQVGKVEGRRGKPLTPEDARAVVEVCESDPYGAMWLTMLGLRLRKAQALNLRWDGVDLDNATAEVPESKGKKARIVPLPADVVTVLRAHRSAQRRQRLAAATWIDTNLVFTSEVGTRIDPRNVNRLWARVLRQAGVESHHTVHDIRHSAATFLRAAGADLKDIQAVLDHTRLSTTSDIYTHIQAEQLRQSAARVDGVLRKLRS
jgi:integrase